MYNMQTLLKYGLGLLLLVVIYWLYVFSQDKDKATFKGEFFMDTESGKEAYNLVKAMGDLQQWSFGFKVDDSEYGKLKKDGEEDKEEGWDRRRAQAEGVPGRAEDRRRAGAGAAGRRGAAAAAARARRAGDARGQKSRRRRRQGGGRGRAPGEEGSREGGRRRGGEGEG